MQVEEIGGKFQTLGSCLSLFFVYCIRLYSTTQLKEILKGLRKMFLILGISYSRVSYGAGGGGGGGGGVLWRGFVMYKEVLGTDKKCFIAGIFL